MTIKLTVRNVVESGAEATEYVFTQDVVSFGRSGDNALVIEDPEKQVSSKHGRLERRDSEWYVFDLGSTNGTQLNDRMLAPKEAALLRDGDTLLVGDHEVGFATMAVPSAAEQTMVHFDAERLVDRLVERVTRDYAEHLHDDAAVRQATMSQAVRRVTAELLPEQARAVLSMLRARLSGTAAVTSAEVPDQAVDRREELYRAGHEILKSLSLVYVGDEPFKRPEDAGRFGQLLNQMLETTMEWLAKCLEGRREFETQFGADVTMMFSLEGNPLKGGQDAEHIARYLLDWRGGRDISRVRSDLQGAFRDLTMHQLGLLAGAQEAVKAVLQRLDPECIEELAASKSKGWMAVLPGSHREWDYYKQAYKELLEEKTRLYEELISPNIRRGYLAAHEKQLADPDTDGADPKPQ